MATAKYNSKAKINFITTVGGKVKWKLNPLGMVATSHGVKRFIARTEVKRVLSDALNYQQFRGIELYSDGQTVMSTWGFTRLSDSGRVRFGCMEFSKSAASALRKWAKVS